MSEQKTNTGKSKPTTKRKSKGSAKPKTMKGLGDVIESITKATGIKSILGDCKGCEQRKEKLNQRFPFFKDAKMNEMQAQVYEHHRESAKRALNEGTINTTNQRPLVQIYNDVFQPRPKQKIITCQKCWGDVERIILQLEQAYLIYKKGDGKK